MLGRRGRLLGSALSVTVGVAGPAWAACRSVERVSVGPGGAAGDGDSIHPAISADGRFVAFISYASNLVPGDTNGIEDVFVRDRRTGTTTRANVGPGGIQANRVDGGFSVGGLAISADGRFVSFTSNASNLVPGDANGVADAFVRDTRLGTTERVSVGPGGVQGNRRSGGDPALAPYGRLVAFASEATNLVPGDANGTWDVLIRDRRTGTTRGVSRGSGDLPGNGPSYPWKFSADGRFLGFWSEASNLVPGDANGVADAFVRDRHLGTTERVSVGPGGAEGNGRSYGPTLSGSGRFAAFGSSASNLVPGDTNGADDIFVHDRRTGTTTRASVGPRGRQANGPSNGLAISADGGVVAFDSDASSLVPGDTNRVTDVFLRDRRTGTTERVSTGRGGTQGNRRSIVPDLSADGRTVAFQSFASNLVPGDTGPWGDIFVCTR